MNTQEQNYINTRKAIDPKEILLFKVEEKIKNARMWLILIGIFTVALAIFRFFVTYHQQFLTGTIIDVSIGLIYLVFAWWVSKKPFTAVLSGLILYITMIIIEISSGPNAISSGWIFRIIIIAAFISGLKAAKQAEKLRRELGIIEENPESEVLIDQL